MNERELIRRVEDAEPVGLAEIFNDATAEEERALEDYLGVDRYRRMRRLAMRVGAAPHRSTRGVTGVDIGIGIGRRRRPGPCRPPVHARGHAGGPARSHGKVGRPAEEGNAPGKRGSRMTGAVRLADLGAYPHCGNPHFRSIDSTQDEPERGDRVPPPGRPKAPGPKGRNGGEVGGPRRGRGPPAPGVT